KGNMAEALAHADAGLARLARKNMQEEASDLLHPELVAERAFVLAALDRDDEARAELATLGPPFPFLDRARLRVGVVVRARQGDLEAAARVVDAAPRDMFVSRLDELLTDVVRATTHRLGVADVARLRAELRAFPEGRRWLETVAPATLDAFDRASDVA